MECETAKNDTEFAAKLNAEKDLSALACQMAVNTRRPLDESIPIETRDFVDKTMHSLISASAGGENP